MARGATRAVVWALALALGGAASCYDSDKLLGADCESDDDCWSDQSCVRTPTQELAGNAPGICGKDGCLPGGQLGCSCIRDDLTNWLCPGSSSLIPIEIPVDNACICCGVSSMAEFNDELGSWVCVDEVGTTGG